MQGLCGADSMATNNIEHTANLILLAMGNACVGDDNLQLLGGEKRTTKISRVESL